MRDSFKLAALPSLCRQSCEQRQLNDTAEGREQELPPSPRSNAPVKVCVHVQNAGVEQKAKLCGVAVLSRATLVTHTTQ